MPGAPSMPLAIEGERVLHRLSLLILVALLVGEVAFAAPTHAAVAATASATAPETAFELNRPPAPLGSYRPRFVHQGLNNCAFASAAMLVDKWTGGSRRPTQERMRAASRVPSTEGVGMGELARAIQSVARIRVLWSPGGGDPLTWDGLMDRLATGGGAVVAGAYSDLPGHYQRWNRAYAALGRARSGHAVYVERYQPGRHGGRVWMMDPLAGGSSYEGEWIAANDLKAFAWRTGTGLVHAVATPEPPPLAGYEFGSVPVVAAGAAVAGERVTISVPLDVRAGWSTPDNLALSVVWKPQSLEPDPDEVAAAYLADVAAARAAMEASASPAARRDPAPEHPAGLADEPAEGFGDDVSPEALTAWRAAQAALAVDEDATADDASQPPAGTSVPALQPTKPVLVPLSARGDVLVARVDAPAAAGTYALSVELRRRDGAEFAEHAPDFDDVTVRLRGPLAAAYGAVAVPDDPVSGAVARIAVGVSNVGGGDWLGAAEALRLVATWDTPAGSSYAASTIVELESGASGKVVLDVIVPTDALAGSLRVGLVTADGVPLSEYGLEPLSLELQFALPAADPDTQAPQE